MASNSAIIRDLYQKFAQRDTEGIRKLFDQNIEWFQMKGFPNGGHYKGSEQIFKHVFQGFREHWTGWKATVTELLESGDSVFAIGFYEGTYNKTGKAVHAEFVHHYTLKGAKIIRFEQYTDTYLVAKAMEA